MQEAAVFIDAENIPAQYADDVYHIVLLRHPFEALVYRYAIGHRENMRDWEPMCRKYEMRSEIMGSYEKHASDERIKNEMWHVFEHDIRYLYLVSNDSGYRTCVNMLQARGCVVRGIGRKNTKVRQNAQVEQVEQIT